MGGSGGAATGALFSQGFPTTLNSNATRVKVDPNGYVFVAGLLQGKATFGTTTLNSKNGGDVLLIKLDPDGNVVWAKAFGDGVSTDVVSSMAVGADGRVVLTGGFSGSIDFGKGPLVSAGGPDMFLVEFDNDGVVQWSSSYGNTGYDQGIAVDLDSAGNVVLLGVHAGNIDFGLGTIAAGPDATLFAAQFDSNGVCSWADGFGGTGSTLGGAAFKKNGHVVLAGGFRSDVKFGTGPTLKVQGGGGSADMFVAELDAMGNHVWSNSYGDQFDQVATSLALTSNDDAIVGGQFGGTMVLTPKQTLTANGNQAGFGMRLDAFGTPTWSLAWGGAQTTTNDVAVDATDAAFFGGQYSVSVSFGGASHPAGTSPWSTYLARLGSGGTELDSRVWDGAVIFGLAVAPVGDAVLGGAYFQPVNFGQGALPAPGGSSMFVARVSP